MAAPIVTRVTRDPASAPDPADESRGLDLGELDLGGLDAVAAWSSLRRGGSDPTFASAGRIIWKGWRTPEGPATVWVSQPRPGDPVTARVWGAGSSWVSTRLPAMLGAHDDPSGFRPHHDVLRQAAARFSGLRVPTTGLVIEALVPSIIEQRVTGAEAFTGYRRLVRRFGEAAPGPAGQRGLLVAPSAGGWAGIPSWAWLRVGIDPGRSDTVMRALRHAPALERCVDLSPAAARARLMAISGVGVWTAAEVAHVALGDADAVSFGDYHVAKDIGVALTGRQVDDHGLERLLAPYVGHRYRVQRLVELAGWRRARHGPRRTLPAHLPTRW